MLVYNQDMDIFFLMYTNPCEAGLYNNRYWLILQFALMCEINTDDWGFFTTYGYRYAHVDVLIFLEIGSFIVPCTRLRLT